MPQILQPYIGQAERFRRHTATGTGTISIGTGSYYDIWDMGPASETIRGNWS